MKNVINNFYLLVLLLQIINIFSLKNNTLHPSFDTSVEAAIESKTNEELQKLQNEIKPTKTINTPTKTIPKIETMKEGLKQDFEKALNSEEFKTDNILKQFKINVSDSSFMAQVNKELPQVYEQAQKSIPYIKNFKLGLEKIKSEYTALLTRMPVPQAINDFIMGVINIAEKTINSNNTLDINLVNSLQITLLNIIDLINKLYINRENLVNAITAADIDKLKLLIKNNFDNFYDFAERNSAQLDTLIQMASLIQPEDAMKFENNAREDHFRRKAVKNTKADNQNKAKGTTAYNTPKEKPSIQSK